MYQETSRIAYAQNVIPTLGTRQLTVYEALKSRENFTNSELAGYLDWSINTVTPRVHELRKMKLVEEDYKRPCRVTGRTAIAWKIIRNTLF